MLARSHQQFVKRSPVIAPVEIEANALAQFLFVNLAPPPFVEDVLVAGEDGFKSQHHGTVSGLGALFQQGRGKALRGRQRMIVADENDVGRGRRGFQLLRSMTDFVGTEGLAEVLQIFAAAVGIVDPDLALHPCQGVQLRLTAPEP